MTNNQVHEALIRWLSGLLAVTVIKDRQAANRPPVPYAMVDLTTWTEVGEHPRSELYLETDNENSEGQLEVLVTPDTEVEWLFSLMVYGPGCEDKLRRLMSAVHLPQVQEPLMPLLHIQELGVANSVPELINEVWEPRAQLNIVVRGRSTEGFVVDTIDEHEFNIAERSS